MKLKTTLLLGFLLAAPFISGCTDALLSEASKSEQPLPENVQQRIKSKDMEISAPIFLRVFKEENVLEVWKQKRNGRYDIIATYNICHWSGKLGPKFLEGDWQAPEGFYTVRPGQMNPQSNYYLSFDMGFPNAYDQVNGRTGRHLMVHGACSSVGCYSMTDANIAHIYAFGRDAFRGGQRNFQIQAFPFRMTAVNMARYHNDPNYEFWTMLKEGYDLFELTRVPPIVDVCEKRYVFNRSRGATSSSGACPSAAYSSALLTAYDVYQKKYETAFQTAVNGEPKKPLPSIDGLNEAKLVVNWSKRRAAGEKVSLKPPYYSAVVQTKEHVTSNASVSTVENVKVSSGNNAARTRTAKISKGLKIEDTIEPTKKDIKRSKRRAVKSAKIKTAESTIGGVSAPVLEAAAPTKKGSTRNKK